MKVWAAIVVPLLLAPWSGALRPLERELAASMAERPVPRWYFLLFLLVGALLPLALRGLQGRKGNTAQVLDPYLILLAGQLLAEGLMTRSGGLGLVVLVGMVFTLLRLWQLRQLWPLADRPPELGRPATTPGTGRYRGRHPPYRLRTPNVDLSKPSTQANLEAAFGGESMANRKYLFFAEVARQLGNKELASLFRDTANQETEHAFAHFRLLHPELVIADPDALRPEEKEKILARCLALAIEGETYEYTTMYPDFAAQARADRDGEAAAEFEGQISEAQEHAALFRRAASNFGFLTPIEQFHAERYGVALAALQGKGNAGEAAQAAPGKWICKVCSMIYDPAVGDPESGIAAGTPFEAIPDSWTCPICGTRKANFIPYREPELQAA